MELYSMSSSQLEDAADQTKAVVLQALVKEGLLEDDIADKWCATHTIIRRRRSIFRTISNKFSKEEIGDGYYIRVVKDVSNNES